MTGFSPFELVFGTDPNDLLSIHLKLNRGLYDLKDPDTTKYLSNLKELLANKTLEAHHSQEKYDSVRKKYYDKSHKKVNFKIGDIVILYIGDKYVGNKKKLLNLYDGPFVIRDIKGKVNYKISRLSDESDLATVHISKLEKFHSDPEFYAKRNITIPATAYQDLVKHQNNVDQQE